MELKLDQKPWWNYLDGDLRDLLREAEHLYTEIGTWDKQFHDYSFLVFPAAKAYEGFLKRIFLDMGFISEADYLGKRFRIGRALNPEIKNRGGNVYKKLSSYCEDKDVPATLWRTWKESRNLLFHWFPNEANAVTYAEAQDRLEMVISAIDAVYVQCKVDLNRP